MGVGYRLVNIDKKQQVCFYNVDTGTKLRELSGTVIASTIVTYYLLTNTGDRIGFINNTEGRFIVCGQNYESAYCQKEYGLLLGGIARRRKTLFHRLQPQKAHARLLQSPKIPAGAH